MDPPIVVTLTVEEAYALWLAYKGPVRKQDAGLLDTGSAKLFDALKSAGVAFAD